MFATTVATPVGEQIKGEFMTKKTKGIIWSSVLTVWFVGMLILLCC